MVNLFREINKKINSVIWSFVSTGIILILLAILIVWTDFMLRLTIGLLVLVMAYAFIYAGYRLWNVKNEIEKHFNL